MGKVIASMTMSLDGFVNDRNNDVDLLVDFGGKHHNPFFLAGFPALKNPDTAAGAFNSGMRKQGSTNSTSSLRAVLSCWDARPTKASQKSGRP